MPLKAFRIVTEPNQRARAVIAAAFPDLPIRQVEAVVYATARVHAVRHFNDVGLRITLGEMTRYGSQSGNPETLAALAKVSTGAVLVRPSNGSACSFVELGKPEGIIPG